MTSGKSRAVLPLYVVATLLFTWPVAARFGSEIPWAYGMTDALMQSYFLGWNWTMLPENPAAVWNLPIFHPVPGALTFMDHMIGEAVAAWPVIALTGNMATAYNTLVLLSFMLSAWWTYRLLRLFGISRGGGFIGGFLFAFSPYRFGHLGALNQLSTQFLPLALFFAVRLVSRRRPRDLLAVALTFAIQVWFGWYYAFHLVVLIGLLLVYEMLLNGVRLSVREGLSVLGAGVLVVALILPGLYPYWREQRLLPGFERTLGMTALWSADILDYLRTNPDNRLFRNVPGLTGDHSFLPGWVTLALAALAGVHILRRPPTGGVETVAKPSDRTSSAWVTVRSAHRIVGFLRRLARRMGRIGFALPLGFTAFVLSLGPILHCAGRVYPIPLPYSLAYFVIPGFSSMRVPARFAVLVLLAAVLLAGAGFDVLRRRIAPGRTPGAVLLGTLTILSALLVWAIPVRTLEFPHRSTMPEAYAWLAAHPAGGPLLELPMPAHVTMEDPLHTRRQFYQLYHGRPRLDGVSGFVPRDYEIFRMVMQGFPREGTLREARRFGARTILVHYGDLDPAARARLESAVAATPSLVLRARFGDDAVYELIGFTP